MVGYDEELLADRSTANRPAEDAPATAMGPGGGNFVGVYSYTHVHTRRWAPSGDTELRRA
jgi:hypothetical protein